MNFSGGLIRGTGKYSYDMHVPGGVALRENMLINNLSPGPPFTKFNDWVLFRESVRPARIDGNSGGTNPFFRHSWEGVPISSNSDATFSSPDYGFLATSALAQMDPEEPIVDLPLFIYELREFPKALRDLGYALSRRGLPLLKDPGGSYIQWKFGWAPLLNDLSSLMNLVEETEKRNAFLRSAAAQDRYKGNLPQSNDPNQGVTYRTFYGNNGATVTYSLTKELREKNWFTSGYVLKSPIPEATSDDYLHAMRRALGLRLSPVTIWNAIPWSWLIDYLSNIGTVIQAMNGMARFEARDMNIMSHSTLRVHYDYVSNTKFTIDPVIRPGQTFFESKRRKVIAFPFPVVRFKPYLSEGQSLILLALGGSKSRNFTRGG